MTWSGTMKAILKTGKVIPMSPDQGRRVLYAVTTLAVSPIGPELNIERIEDGSGQEVWPCMKSTDHPE